MQVQILTSHPQGNEGSKATEDVVDSLGLRGILEHINVKEVTVKYDDGSILVINTVSQV